MSVVFNISIHGKVGVLQPEGRIISDEGIAELFATVEQHQKAGVIYWVCDAAKLDYCNSTGLNFFVRLLTKSRNVGGDCALVDLQPMVAKLFQLSKLNEIFTSYASVEDAEANYNSIA